MALQERTLLSALDRSITFRFLTVIALILGLMIPLFLVFNVVTDRESFYEFAVDSIAKSWAGSQLVTGPMMVIPFEIPSARDDESVDSSEIFVMPKSLSVSIESTHEYRRRGIFEVPVLDAMTKMIGSFDPLDLEALESRYGKLKLEHAQILIGIGDALGVRNAQLKWNQADARVEGTEGFGSIRHGIQVSNVHVSGGGSFDVAIDLRFTQRIGVLLVGDESMLQVNSSWQHPAFDGRSLPDSSELAEDGFTASWSSHALARGYPSIVSRSKWDIARETEETRNPTRIISSMEQPMAHPESVGFSVIEPVTPYRAVNRALKYGVMFIVLTLISVLCIELVLKQQFHIVQYGVVGLSLLMFYLLLLSLSEHIGFGWSYLIAALILSTMITVYAWSVTKHRPTTLVIALILTLLYVALYTILQLDQYSLLVGTALLLLLLGALMVATRGLRVESPANTVDSD